MLHAKALPKVLEQAAGGGVSAAMLLNAQGELVAAAPAKVGAGQRHRHAGAIAATVWETYARLCGGDSDAQLQQQHPPLAELLFDCEAGRVSAAAVGASGFLLCLVAKQSPQQPAAEFGMLRRKSQALVAALAQPLSEWASAAPRS